MKKVKRIIGNCLQCGKKTIETEKRIAIGRGKFCSRSCSMKYYSQKHLTGFKLGNTVGIDNLIPGKKGADGGNWKGDEVKYSGLHVWIRKQLGTPSKCEVCGTTTAKKFVWANVDHKYKRNLIDWKRMCQSCHLQYDRKNKIINLRHLKYQ